MLLIGGGEWQKWGFWTKKVELCVLHLALDFEGPPISNNLLVPYEALASWREIWISPVKKLSTTDWRFSGLILQVMLLPCKIIPENLTKFRGEGLKWSSGLALYFAGALQPLLRSIARELVFAKAMALEADPFAKYFTITLCNMEGCHPATNYHSWLFIFNDFQHKKHFVQRHALARKDRPNSWKKRSENEGANEDLLYTQYFQSAMISWLVIFSIVSGWSIFVAETSNQHQTPTYVSGFFFTSESASLNQPQNIRISHKESHQPLRIVSASVGVSLSASMWVSERECAHHPCKNYVQTNSQVIFPVMLSRTWQWIISQYIYQVM